MTRELIYFDIGARWGIEEPWSYFRDNIRLVCFEPDEAEYNSLKNNKYGNDIILPYALYDDSRTIPLYLTKNRSCSSLYKPNLTFLSNYADWTRFEVEDSVMLTTTSLDLLHQQNEISAVDFMKVDVQGAEFNILRGGESFLRNNIIGIEVEVEFQHMYEDQPLFSDVDKLIRDVFNLQLQDLRKTYWKYPEGQTAGTTKGQLIFGDALYFRSPQEILSWCSHLQKDEAVDKLKMACLMGIIYGYLDYSLCILDQPAIRDFLDQRTMDKWRSMILQYGRSLRYSGIGAGKLSNLFNLMYRLCQPTHQGWACTGHHLGARKRFGVFG